MSTTPAMVYLEADDEITSVIRRVRDADADRVIVVVPGRSRATSSAVALRLLARAGEAAGKEIAVVGDPLTRSLAAEAGLASAATLEEARGPAPLSTETPPPPRHAAIHVVRGTEETAATPVVAVDEVTRPVPVVALSPEMRRGRGLVAVVAAVVVLALLAGLTGAAILPGASVTIDPVTEAVGPVPYVIEVAQPERLRGTEEATAKVTATGTYDIREPASGVVTFRNWSSSGQPIAAGTLVAAGEQAYETQADIVVPRGELTAEGTIRAGEQSVEVVASAPGPAGNVGAGEINTVLSQNADARLRGFPENTQGRVLNPDPTTGGADEAGTEITQADVDAAVAALGVELRSRVADQLEASADAIVVQPELDEPAIDGLDDLVGTRDQAEATIEATLPWEAWTADRNEVTEAARGQLADDPSAVPDGHALLHESIEVVIEEATVEGGIMRVDVTASGRSAAQIDRDAVAERIAGLSADEAEAALEDVGAVTVELWPDWVASVPTLTWRIDVRIGEP